MGWPILNVLQALVAVLWTLIWVPTAVLLQAVTQDRPLPLILARRAWAPGLLKLGGAKLQISGLEHLINDWQSSAKDAPRINKSYVFVANHESTLDIPTVFAALPENLHFILKKELFWVPLIGFFAWATGMIFVDRDDRLSTLRSLRKVTRIIKGGCSVMAFPEGTRNRGTILPFKKGVFVAALQAGVPIVPIAIIGTAEIMPRESIRIRPGPVQVRIGAPIQTASLTTANTAHVMAEAHARVCELYAAGIARK